jgi:hypothetical protein
VLDLTIPASVLLRADQVIDRSFHHESREDGAHGAHERTRDAPCRAMSSCARSATSPSN